MQRPISRVEGMHEAFECEDPSARLSDDEWELIVVCG